MSYVEHCEACEGNGVTIDQMIAEAVKAEREACANVAHNYGLEAHVTDHGDCVACSIPTKIADKIRARA